MEQLSYLIWGIAAIMAVFMLFRLVKARSVAGMMFGAPVGHTVGEVEVKGPGVTQVARVHVLESTEPNRAVGIELVSRTKLSYGMVPLVLSKEQARQIASLLEKVAI